MKSNLSENDIRINALMRLVTLTRSEENELNYLRSINKDDNTAKSKTISFRVSEEEYNLIRDFALIIGLESVSQYVRSAILDDIESFNEKFPKSVS